MNCPVCNCQLHEYNLVCPECRISVAALVKISHLRSELSETRQEVLSHFNRFADLLDIIEKDVANDVARAAENIESNYSAITSGEISRGSQPVKSRQISQPTTIKDSSSKLGAPSNPFWKSLLLFAVLTLIMIFALSLK